MDSLIPDDNLGRVQTVSCENHLQATFVDVRETVGVEDFFSILVDEVQTAEMAWDKKERRYLCSHVLVLRVDLRSGEKVEDVGDVEILPHKRRDFPAEAVHHVLLREVEHVVEVVESQLRFVGVDVPE